MTNKHNWNEIGKDISDFTNKVKIKLDEEDLVDDLKQSLKETIENTGSLIKNMISSVESTVNDEDIKHCLLYTSPSPRDG